MQELIIKKGKVNYKKIESNFIQWIEVDSNSFMVETDTNTYNFYYNDTLINGVKYNNFSELPL
jgi:hypothetical protein